MGLLKLGELKIIGDKFFLKVMIEEAEFLGLGLEEMLGVVGRMGIKLGPFEFIDLEFVEVRFIPLLLETLLDIL